MPQTLDDKAADTLIRVHQRKIEVQALVEMLNPCPCIDQVDAFLELLYLGFFLVELVQNLADQFLKHILDGHYPCKRSVLVKNDGHVLLLNLKFF